MNIKKILYIIFGCISFGLGAVGAVLPVLPTFPFLIFAAFCFARSSKKLDNHFRKSSHPDDHTMLCFRGQLST